MSHTILGSKYMKKKASILVPFSGDSDLLQLFFECFNKSHDVKEYELILIGDGCQNPKVIAYAEHLKSTRMADFLILSESPIGFGQANNRGAEKASTERLVFVNDDILLMDHEIDALLQEQDRLDCAAIQPVLLYPQTNLIQSTGHIFGDNFNRHAQQGIGRSSLVLPYSTERQALTLSFCAIKKNVFFQLGGFDPFYYNAYEGLELTHRIHAKKLGCKVAANVFAYHIQSCTRNTYARSEERYMPYFWLRNHATLCEDLTEEWKRVMPAKAQERPYFCINFSPLRLTDFVEKAGFSLHGSVELPLNGNINLLTAIPFAYVQMPVHLMMICDSFSQLRKNVLWKRMRKQTNDIVLDACGNALFLSDIVG